MTKQDTTVHVIRIQHIYLSNREQNSIKFFTTRRVDPDTDDLIVEVHALRTVEVARVPHNDGLTYEMTPMDEHSWNEWISKRETAAAMIRSEMDKRENLESLVREGKHPIKAIPAMMIIGEEWVARHADAATDAKRRPTFTIEDLGTIPLYPVDARIGILIVRDEAPSRVNIILDETNQFGLTQARISLPPERRTIH